MPFLKTLTRRAAIVALAVALPACSNTSPSDGTLEIVDVIVGTGSSVVAGDTITVSYVGTLTNGNQFDSGTYTTRIGVGAVIKGWDQGLIGMRVGGTRRLTIPPSLGYGSQAQATIPANSTLKFEIRLLAIAGK